MSAGPTSFCGIELAHPIINASGTFDAIAARRAFGDAVVERFPFSAYVSKTITPAPRAGNPPPRLWEEPAAMVNSIGLPNKGAEGLDLDLPALADLPVPLIVCRMATSAEEFSGLVEAVSARDEVAAIELNVSCPNVHSGLIVGEQPSETEALLEALRPPTAKPSIVKLTPTWRRPGVGGGRSGGRGGRGVAHQHAQGAPDVRREAVARRRERRSVRAGGPAVALQQVSDVAAAVSIPIAGMGGVESGSHARDLLDVGAEVVAVGTASLGPAGRRAIPTELRGLIP